MEPVESVDINSIVSKYNLELLVYFGSYLTEYYNVDSDIDIAFLCSVSLNKEDRNKLHEALILFHRKSEIDLVDLKTADPVLKYEVAIKGKILFEKEKGLFDIYCNYYIKMFYELKPLILEELETIKGNIRRVLADD